MDKKHEQNGRHVDVGETNMTTRENKGFESDTELSENFHKRNGHLNSDTEVLDDFRKTNGTCGVKSSESKTEIVKGPESRNGTIQHRGAEGSESEGSTSGKGEYRVYSSRWFMLFIVCFQNVTNAMMWITFAAAADTTVAFFEITPLKVNMLSMVFMIASIPFGFIASWVLDTFGLRASLILSAWLTGLGGLLRNLSTLDIVPRNHSYTILIIGQSLAAIAQPFIMFTPTKLAALWFPENRRATANMIGSMMNPLGNMLTFIIVPLIVEGPSDIPLALWVVSAPAFFITIVTTLGVRRSSPPTPPSPSAGEESESFLVGLKTLACSKNYLVLNFAFGVGLGLFTALATLLEQILCPRGYSDDFAGLCGALMIVCGVIMSGVAGVYVDKTKRFDEVLKVSFAIATLAGIAFTQVSRLRDQQALVAITLALFGGFGLVIYPISMELAVEVTYPVAEATSSGLCIVSGQVLAIATLLSMQYIAQPLSGYESQLETGCHISENSTDNFVPQDWTYSNLFIFNVFSTVAVVVTIIFFKPVYRRLNAEKKAELLAKTVAQNEISVRHSNDSYTINSSEGSTKL
ncbi:solute carrier family 49 member A3-like [Mya arenaria]|uniref:solute carrier family 49 member A3-like n=1 Tax=Mya arenaria TaxID=6604 RepID=UPI0022E07981|nr:solute carrier family 49 member A3-like [Mya arenaria]XP_052772965.1 solute carrier family 49 member A3-like [Mya arenaria]XP_052773118.1 solute carrier family 49 member A3-like [Mya arenaria]